MGSPCRIIQPDPTGPSPIQRGQALLQTLAGFDPDFVASLEEHQAQKPPLQDRELL